MGAHAKLAASKTKTWWYCPGYIAALEAFPEFRSGSSEYAQLGTAAHALCERCLTEGSYPEDYRDRIIVLVEKDNGDEGTSILRPGAKTPGSASAIWFEVDDDMLEATSKFVAYVERRLVELGALKEGEKRPPSSEIKGLELLLETQTIPLPERDDTGGTADVTIDCWPDVLEIVDYKHGQGVFVPIANNYQLLSYLLGKALETDFSHDAYRMTIVQPRHRDAPYDGVMSCEVSREELLEFQTGLQEAAMRVDAARDIMEAHMTDGGSQEEGANVLLEVLYRGGTISVGEDGSHCTFCEFMADCPSCHAKAQETAAIDFDDEPGEIEVPDNMSRIAEIAPWIKFIDKWSEKVMVKAKAHILSGGTQIETMKPVRSNGKRVWRRDLSQEQLIEKCVEEHGLSRDDLVEESLITGPKAEKLFKGSGSGIKKQAFGADLLEKIEGSITIAPLSDKRQAVEIDPGADFDDGLGD